MNVEQYLLMKLAEEATEIAHIAMKAMQFGLQEIYPEIGTTNGDRLNGELVDLHGVLEMLQEGAFIVYDPCPHAIEDKKRKVRKYLKYSRELGMVE